MRTHLLFEEEQEGPEWVITYHLGYAELDDDIDGSDSTEVILNAIDFDTAVKYAQQYLRKKKSEEKTSTEWENAQILSIELR